MYAPTYLLLTNTQFEPNMKIVPSLSINMQSLSQRDYMILSSPPFTSQCWSFGIPFSWYRCR